MKIGDGQSVEGVAGEAGGDLFQHDALLSVLFADRKPVLLLAGHIVNEAKKPPNRSDLRHVEFAKCFY
jgi:hypothetical protein